MTYKLLFDEEALDEWKKLDGSVKEQFKKVLLKRLENPRVESAKLSDMKDCYKIKLRTTGYRLVYQVEDKIVVITVISVGRRDKSVVYEKAVSRLKRLNDKTVEAIQEARNGGLDSVDTVEDLMKDLKTGRRKPGKKK